MKEMLQDVDLPMTKTYQWESNEEQETQEQLWSTTTPLGHPQRDENHTTGLLEIDMVQNHISKNNHQLPAVSYTHLTLPTKA